jgi:hypothetical protein
MSGYARIISPYLEAPIDLSDSKMESLRGVENSVRSLTYKGNSRTMAKVIQMERKFASSCEIAKPRIISLAGKTQTVQAKARLRDITI